MKEEHNLTEVPHNYPVCLNCQCSQALTCLRRIVEQEIPDSVEFLVVINPKHQATLNGDCPYYRSNIKVRYAKGFINILENLPHKQMQDVISLLVSRFSQRTYYRIRKGERLLSPYEQQEILNILKRCGITSTQEFDAYVENYQW